MKRKQARKPKARRPRKQARTQRRTSLRARRQRTAIILSLEKLSKPLQSDVLADGSISREFDLAVKNTVTLGSAVSVPRDAVFTAFREALRRGGEVRVKDRDGKVTDAAAAVNDGVGSIILGSTQFLFANAGLLAGSARDRKAFAESALKRNSLHSALAHDVIRLASKPSSDNAAFEAMGALASSPEAFFSLFKEKLEKAGQDQTVSRSDLLPDDDRYWDNLTPPPTGQADIASYVRDVLVPEGRGRLSRGGVTGFSMLTPLFVSPASVPHVAFEDLSADALADAIEKSVMHDGHFALLGLVEICARRVNDDARFAALGERALGRLFSDMTHLEHSCALFAPTFVIATAYLAEPEKFQTRPVYWRRLAAAAHAGLIVRACGVTTEDYSGLFRWAIQVSGNEYMMSVFADMAEEPNWRPDWIRADFMVADAVGRMRLAEAGFAEGVTHPGWRTIIAAAKDWIDQRHLGPATMFPCILEGARRPAPTLDKVLAEADKLAAFRADPSPDHLREHVVFGYIFGFPSEMLAAIASATEQVRHDPRNFDDRDVQLACIVAAHAAARAQDAALATLTSDVVLEKLRGATGSTTIFEAICVLLTCAGAYLDPEIRHKDIGQRLEHIAFTMPPSPALLEVTSAIAALRGVQPSLSPNLGRAAAAARLGSP